jgi:hypothetical protein
LLFGAAIIDTVDRFSQGVLIDTTPMPDDIPKVKEIGVSSAPLMSAAYFIGARCQPYNDDYMQCKTESYGRGELDCLKEGRRVTRCAASVSVWPMVPAGEDEISASTAYREHVLTQSRTIDWMISTRTA